MTLSFIDFVHTCTNSKIALKAWKSKYISRYYSFTSYKIKCLEPHIQFSWPIRLHWPVCISHTLILVSVVLVKIFILSKRSQQSILHHNVCKICQDIVQYVNSILFDTRINWRWNNLAFILGYCSRIYTWCIFLDSADIVSISDIPKCYTKIFRTITMIDDSWEIATQNTL